MITRWSVLSQLWIICLFQASAMDYCLMERFEASCPQESFILIRSAYYGRMKMGRCLPRDYYIGCHADVTAHLDAECSGRSYCQLSVPEHSLLKVVPCPQDLVFYLQVDFTCVTGQSASPKTCAEEKLLRIVNSRIGYLTSDFTLSTEMGSSRCPWQVVALPGQRINITLFNLRTVATPTEVTPNSSTSGLGKSSLTGSRTKRCPNVLATVRESPSEGGATMTTTTSVEEIICASALRETTAYLSQANSLTIVMTPTKGSAVHSSIKYIIKYEVTGCPEPEVPPGTYMTRDGDQAFFYCNQPHRQQHMWKMSCKGTEWIGQTGYCIETTNQPSETDSMTVVKEEKINILQLSAQQAGIGTVLVIGVSVGIILGICCLFTLSSVWHSYFSTIRSDDPSSSSAPADVMTWKRICPLSSSSSLRTWIPSESCANELHLRYMRRRTTGHEGLTVGGGGGGDGGAGEGGEGEVGLTMAPCPTTRLLGTNSIVYVARPDSAAAARDDDDDDDDDDEDKSCLGRLQPHADAQHCQQQETNEERRTSLTSDLDLLTDLSVDDGPFRTVVGRESSCCGKSPSLIQTTSTMTTTTFIPMTVNMT